MASFKIYLVLLFNVIISSILMINLSTLLFDDTPNNPPDFSNISNQWNSIFKTTRGDNANMNKE